MRKYPLLVVLALLATVAGAQYAWTPNMSLADNTAWCATGNCLTSIGGTMAETKAGYDGTIYGLSASGVLSTYTPATGWVQAASGLQTAGGQPLMHISVSSQSEMLALSTAASPDNNVYVLNAADTAWQALAQPENFTRAEIGSDGEIWGINAKGANFYWNLSTLTWTETSSGQDVVTIAVASAENAWAISSYQGGLIYQWNPSVGDWGSISPAPGFVPSEANNALAAVGETNLAVLDTSGGIHISTNSGATWSTIAGTAKAITGAGVETFTLDSSGVSYHLNLLVPELTVTGTGSYQCPAEGCPQGSYHTLKATAYFGGAGGNHGSAGVTSSAQGYPANLLTASASEFSSLCDPFYGDPGNLSLCQAYESGSVNCVVMGLIDSVEGLSITPPTIKITNTYWGPPPIVVGDTCTYNILACSTGTATCKGATPALSFTEGCPSYVKAQYLVVNGTCDFSLVFSATGPGVCN